MGGLGKFDHTDDPAPLDKQTVIRVNREALFFSGLDLDAGPVTFTLPDPGKRFMSMQVIDEDQYTHAVHYGGGSYSLNRKNIGTRFVVAAVRTLADPSDPADLQKVHASQDTMKVDDQEVAARLRFRNGILSAEESARCAARAGPGWEGTKPPVSNGWCVSLRP